MKQFKSISKFIPLLITNVLFQGGLLLTIENFFSGGLNYLFNILTARVLGPAGYGEVTAFYSYLIILSTPIGIFITYLVLKIGEKNDSYAYARSVLEWTSWIIKKNWYFLLFLLIFIPLLPSITNLSTLVAYSLIPILILVYISAFYDGIMQGLHKLAIYAFLGVVFSSIKLIGPIISLLTVPHIGYILFFFSFALLTKLFISNRILQKKFKELPKRNLKINKTLIDVFRDKRLWLTAISSTSIGLFSNIDIIYVKRVFSAEDAGIYSSWALFAKIILYILGPLIALSFIFFSSKKHEIHHQVFFIGSFILLILAGVSSLIIYGIFPKLIIDLLFGPKYYPVIPFLEWAGLFGVSNIMLLFMNNYFLAKKSKQSLILAGSLPLYCIALIMWGKDLANVMVVNITFSFAVLSIYLLLYFKSRISSLFS